MTEVDDNASGRGLGGNLSPPTCSSIGQSSHDIDSTEMTGRSGPCPRRTKRSATESKSGTSKSGSLVHDRMTSMGGNSESSDEHQNKPNDLPSMQPYDRRLKLPTIPEYGDQLTGSSSSGRKRRRNNNASHKGISSGSGRSRQRRRTLATSTLAFCAALIGVINLGSGGGHYHGGRDGFLLRGSYSPDLVGSGANPLSRRDVRRILAAIEDSDGDASSAEDVGDRAHRSLSSTPSENVADGQQRTLAGIDDERLLQAFSPDEYRLLQAATQTAEYKKNPVGVMTMLLQHLKQVKDVAKVTGSNDEGAGETKEGENTSEGAGSDENEDNGDEKDKDKSQYSDRMTEVIDHLYRKATRIRAPKEERCTQPPTRPSLPRTVRALWFQVRWSRIDSTQSPRLRSAQEDARVALSGKVYLHRHRRGDGQADQKDSETWRG